LKCLNCNVEVEAMLYKKHPNDKQRYIVFVCPKCKNAITTDIKSNLIEMDIEEQMKIARKKGSKEQVKYAEKAIELGYYVKRKDGTIPDLNRVATEYELVKGRLVKRKET
jgi:hypothetical protein